MQAICTFNQKIIVGTRNVNIKEFDINFLSEENTNNVNNNANKNNINKEKEEISCIDISKQNEIAIRNYFDLFASKHVLLNFFDNHPPFDIAVDISSKRIFNFQPRVFSMFTLRKICSFFILLILK